MLSRCHFENDNERINLNDAVWKLTHKLPSNRPVAYSIQLETGRINSICNFSMYFFPADPPTTGGKPSSTVLPNGSDNDEDGDAQQLFWKTLTATI